MADTMSARVERGAVAFAEHQQTDPWDQLPADVKQWFREGAEAVLCAGADRCLVEALEGIAELAEHGTEFRHLRLTVIAGRARSALAALRQPDGGNER